MASRVLILDDSLAVQQSLRLYMEDCGYDVRAAGRIEDGLARLAESPCDVAVVDMRLAGESGEAFVMAAHERWPRLRFVIYTGSNGFELTPALRAVGVRPEDVFHKPVVDLSVIARAVGHVADAAEEG